MPQQDTISHVDLRLHCEAIVSLVERPATAIVNGDEILAHNALWAQVTRVPSDPARRLTLEHGLREFASAEALMAAMRSGSRPAGVMTLRRALARSSREEPEQRAYSIRWRPLLTLPACRGLIVVSLDGVGEADNLTSVLSSQRARIDQLLIRQTLIEETERRRLGRALHDVVAQNLAQLRAALVRDGQSPGGAPSLVPALDRVIEDVRTLAFELSPPVLEDLGLRPALQWLAEHLSRRYGTHISVADDASEPRLSNAARTIVFRAVRELLINAAKYAPGSEIIISCVTNHRTACIVVRDTGPGFDASLAHRAAGATHSFGLLSVEQQIRGIGGTFDLVTSVGDGTRVKITVPIEPAEVAAHD